MVFCSFSFGADEDCFWYGLAATFLFAYGLFTIAARGAAAALLLKEEEDIIDGSAPNNNTSNRLILLSPPQ